MPGASPLLSQPVFLVGAERSGTTIFRLMLNHHPEITWGNEFEYAVDLIDETGKFPPLEKYYEWLKTNRVFQASNLTIDADLDYAHLVDSFLRQRQAKYQKSMVGATVHRHFERLPSIWSDARFIHIIRDGRDVARSCIGMGWAGNVWTGVERWIEVEQQWERLSSTLESHQKLDIFYEELILDYVGTLKKVCQFMGVSYSPLMLSYVDSSDYELPDARLVEQWKRKQSEYEVRLSESRMGDLLVKKGYKPSGFEPLEVDDFLKFKLKLEDWWKRLNFRINYYGFDVILLDFIARKTNNKTFQERMLLKRNAIINGKIKKSI